MWRNEYYLCCAFIAVSLLPRFVAIATPYTAFLHTLNCSLLIWLGSCMQLRYVDKIVMLYCLNSILIILNALYAWRGEVTQWAFCCLTFWVWFNIGSNRMDKTYGCVVYCNLLSLGFVRQIVSNQSTFIFRTWFVEYCTVQTVAKDCVLS